MASETWSTRARLIAGALLLLSLSPGAPAAKPMQFWNLTSVTIDHLYLMPAGAKSWGDDLCASDPDGSVDPDERMRLNGLAPGRYDVKLVDAKGRTCFARDVELRADRPYAFALSDSDLRDCRQG
jgi:hypothetical protein